MHGRNLLIGCGLASFLITLIALLPAGPALRLLSATAPAGAVSGTLWRGEAQALQIGSRRLGHTTWSVHPVGLATGRLAANVETQWSGGRASGHVALGLTGNVVLKDSEAAGAIASLRDWLPVPELSGDLQLKLQVLEIADKWVRRAVGSARVTNMPLTLPGQPALAGAIGSYEVSFNADPVPETGVVEAAITDVSGPLQIAAKLRLTPPGSYALAGTVRPRPDAPPVLTDSLALLGPRQADGSYDIALTGSF